jgi:hypothetical protein
MKRARFINNLLCACNAVLRVMSNDERLKSGNSLDLSTSYEIIYNL